MPLCNEPSLQAQECLRASANEPVPPSTQASCSPTLSKPSMARLVICSLILKQRLLGLVLDGTLLNNLVNAMMKLSGFLLLSLILLFQSQPPSLSLVASELLVP